MSIASFPLPGGSGTGSVPEGWTVGRTSGGAGSPEASILAAGESLRIAFRPIALDSAAGAYVGSRGVGELAAMVRTLHDSSAGAGREGIERITIRGRRCAAFEVGDDSDRRRIVVLRAGGAYYECEAWIVSPRTDPAARRRLFGTQEAVIATIRPEA